MLNFCVDEISDPKRPKMQKKRLKLPKIYLTNGWNHYNFRVLENPNIILVSKNSIKKLHDLFPKKYFKKKITIFPHWLPWELNHANM